MSSPEDEDSRSNNKHLLKKKMSSVRFQQVPSSPAASDSDDDDDLDTSEAIRASSRALNGIEEHEQEPSSRSLFERDDDDDEAPKNSTTTTTTTKNSMRKRNNVGLGGKQLSFKDRAKRRLTARSASFDIGGKGYLTKEESAARALADETGNVPASAVVMLMNRLKDTDKKVVKLKFVSFSTLILLIGVGAALAVIVIMAGQNTMGVIEENAVTSVEKDPQGVTHLSDKETGDVLTVRGDGDTFVATQRHLEGKSYQCIPITKVAAMVNDVSHATSASLVFKNEEGIESKVLSLAGDFEDEGDTLTFADKKITVMLNSDACNQARRLIATSEEEEGENMNTNFIKTKTGQRQRGGGMRAVSNPMSVPPQVRKRYGDRSLLHPSNSGSGNDGGINMNPAMPIDKYQRKGLTEAEVTEKHRNEYVAARLALSSSTGTGAADGRYLESLEQAKSEVLIFEKSDGYFTTDIDFLSSDDNDLPEGTFFIKSFWNDAYIYVSGDCVDGGDVMVVAYDESPLHYKSDECRSEYRDRFLWKIVKNAGAGYRIRAVCSTGGPELVLAPRSLKCNDGEQIVLTKWEGNSRQKFVDGVSADAVREFNVVGTCGQEITLSTGDFGDSLKLTPSSTISTENGGLLEKQRWVLQDLQFKLAGCQEEARACGRDIGSCCLGLECKKREEGDSVAYCFKKGIQLYSGCKKTSEPCGASGGRSCCVGMECHVNPNPSTGWLSKNDDNICYGTRLSAGSDVPLQEGRAIGTIPSTFEPDQTSEVFVIKSLTTAGAYIRVPDGEPNQVCKEGGAVWVGFAPLDSGDAENVLPRFRWRFTKTRDMVRISSVFCEGIGEYVLSPMNGIDSDIVLKKWFQPVGRQSFKKDQLWINWLPTNAVRQFRSLSCTSSCAIRGPICIVSNLNGNHPNCRLQLRRTEYSADQQWVLLDENALHLSGCKEAGERCENDGDCCFGMECDGLARCRHQPRQLGEPCSAINKCADPYHCGGIGGHSTAICVELDRGVEGQNCGNIFGCQEGLFCVRRQCLYNGLTKFNWGCVAKSSGEKGECHLAEPCVCTKILPCASSLAPDSEELTEGISLATPQQEKYKAYVSDIIEKQSELDEILRKLEAVNLFQDDRDNDNDGYGISWSKYLPYTIGELEKPATLCFPSHGIDGPLNAMLQSLCNEPDANCDSSVSMTSTPSFRPSISSMSSLGEICTDAIQADVEEKNLSDRIEILQEELDELRGKRDALIERANEISVGVGAAANTKCVDWYAMQQFKNTWKAKGALLNKCTVISGTIWIIKMALNKIIQAILATFLNAGGPFYVALCESGLELGPLGDISNDYLSYVPWAAQIALDQLYFKYRDEGKKDLAERMHRLTNSANLANTILFLVMNVACGRVGSIISNVIKPFIMCNIKGCEDFYSYCVCPYYFNACRPKRHISEFPEGEFVIKSLAKDFYISVPLWRLVDGEKVWNEGPEDVCKHDNTLSVAEVPSGDTNTMILPMLRWRFKKLEDGHVRISSVYCENFKDGFEYVLSPRRLECVEDDIVLKEVSIDSPISQYQKWKNTFSTIEPNHFRFSLSPDANSTKEVDVDNACTKDITLVSSPNGEVVLPLLRDQTEDLLEQEWLLLDKNGIHLAVDLAAENNDGADDCGLEISRKLSFVELMESGNSPQSPRMAAIAPPPPLDSRSEGENL